MENKLQAGLKERTGDERDFRLGQIIRWPKLEDLPDSYKIEPLSIKDQSADGNGDFCTAYALAGMIEPKEETILWPDYLFAAGKHESGEDPDSWGLQLRDIGKGLVKWGVPAEASVDDNTRKLTPHQRRQLKYYPASLREVASKHRAKSFFFVVGSPYDSFDTARAALWYFRDKKQLIMFGVRFGWSLDQYILDGIPKGGYGHAMYLDGWNKDFLIAVNSAGNKAGRNGEHLITRQVFNHFADQFGQMMTPDIDIDDVRTYYLPNGIKIDDNAIKAFLKSLWALLKGTEIRP